MTFGGEILSHTDAPPVKKTSRTLTYGPYEDTVASFANYWLKFHAINNAPFAAARSVAREIEVSHWGNIYVEERYLVVRTTQAIAYPVLTRFSLQSCPLDPALSATTMHDCHETAQPRTAVVRAIQQRLRADEFAEIAGPPCFQEHYGAKLTGPWSRLDFTSDPAKYAQTAITVRCLRAAVCH